VRPNRRRIANVSTAPFLFPVVPTIRPARPDDESAIEAVHEAAIRAFGPAAYDEVQVSAWANEEVDETGWGVGDVTDLGADDRYAVVAEVEDEIAGFGRIRLGAIPDAPADRLLALVDRPVAEVTAVYVHPDHARTGLGTAILDALEARAREAGATVIGLLAARNAVEFYEGNGYEAVASRSHEPAEGVEMAATWMEKAITDQVV
jgi:putative acetyltransferase